MSIKQWKFHLATVSGHWRQAERIEADYPKHPMPESYVLYSDHLAAVEAVWREGAVAGAEAALKFSNDNFFATKMLEKCSPSRAEVIVSSLKREG